MVWAVGAQQLQRTGPSLLAQLQLLLVLLLAHSHAAVHWAANPQLGQVQQHWHQAQPLHLQLWVESLSVQQQQQQQRQSHFC
jgi:Spy/CpxP family protein refolding chaperone